MQQETISHASGFSFELVELRDYIRKDGTPTKIKVWRAHCSKCDEPFDVTTPQSVTSIEQSHALKARQCDKHRAEYAVRKENLRKARAAKRANRDAKIAP